MSAHRPYFGVTGIMSAVEARAVISSWREAWSEAGAEPTHDLMVGVLASAKTLRGEQNKHPLRYLRRSEIAECFVPERGVLNLLHYASDDAPDPVMLHLLMLAGGPWCHGFQFNVSWPRPEALIEFIKHNPPARPHPQRGQDGLPWRIVLQVGPKLLEELGYDPAAICERVKPYDGIATDVLVDVSGGRGVGIPDDPDQRTRVLRVVETVAAAFDSIRVGIAGGACAETLTEDASIWGFVLDCGWSIDAEGRLRDDAPGGGNLDLEKVRAYLRAAVKLAAGGWS